MKIYNRIIFTVSLLFAGIAALTSCDSGQSYADLLSAEDKSVNRFLANQEVILEIPADSVFEEGENAPYYRLDPDNNIYMQVISTGKGEKAKDDEVIYFRYLRYNLSYYITNSLDNLPSSGNYNDVMTSLSFRYNNFTLPSTSQWGTGIQMPLQFLPVDSEVNLVVKSQFGLTSELSVVQPFLYRIRYYKSMI